MAIDIKIGDEQQATEPEEEKAGPSDLKLRLNIRRTLGGDIIVHDHPMMDIAVQPEKMKIVAFPKTVINDEVYASQNRLFHYLQKNGIIKRESVKGGYAYGALEGTIEPPTKPIFIDEVAVFSVGKFIEEERPSYIYEKAVEEKEVDRLTDPDVEDSTELGEIPHEEEKGSIIPHQVRRYVQGF